MANCNVSELSPAAQHVRERIARGGTCAHLELRDGTPLGRFVDTVEDFDALVADAVARGLRDVVQLRFHEQL